MLLDPYREDFYSGSAAANTRHDYSHAAMSLTRQHLMTGSTTDRDRLIADLIQLFALAGAGCAVYSPALSCYRPDGEIGKHRRLKICRPQGLAGSIPARGTKKQTKSLDNQGFLFLWRNFGVTGRHSLAPEPCGLLAKYSSAVASKLCHCADTGCYPARRSR